MRDTLHFLTCGSASEGQSTLVAKLVAATSPLSNTRSADFIDHGCSDSPLGIPRALRAESRPSVRSTTLESFEDCVFSTSKRRFSVTDTSAIPPIQRGLSIGVFMADLAVLVVDASNGGESVNDLPIKLLRLSGIRHLIIAINKMDLVGWDRDVFQRVVSRIYDQVNLLGFESIRSLPVSALSGDNITTLSSLSPWYEGLSLLLYLEQVEPTNTQSGISFRMPIECMNQSTQSTNSYSGRIAAGKVQLNDRVRIVPGGYEASVRSIVFQENNQVSASSGDKITILLDNCLEFPCGGIISAATDPPESSDQFETSVLCLPNCYLKVGCSYHFSLHTCKAVATVIANNKRIHPRCSVDSHLQPLEEAFASVYLNIDHPVPFELHRRSRCLGSFILSDQSDGHVIGIGLIDAIPRKSAQIHWQAMTIDKNMRAAQKQQKPACLWLTGLPASGKSTVANLLEQRLFSKGYHTYILDGDNVRHGLNKDLGFSADDRMENIRRVAEVAKLIVDAGLVVIVSFISPYRSERETARTRFLDGEFLEVFVDTPLEECERRDPKGLYAKARRGDLPNFTGIGGVYERPLDPEVHLNTLRQSPEACVDAILAKLLLRWHSKVDGEQPHVR